MTNEVILGPGETAPAQDGANRVANHNVITLSCGLAWLMNASRRDFVVLPVV